MSTLLKLVIVSVLAAAVAAVVVLKEPPRSRAATAAAPSEPGQALAVPTAVPKAALPRLVDLGAGKCIPCKLMAPILEELKKEFADRFEVQFIDVWENPDAGKRHGIAMIPTQIFFDAGGKELFRHVGFFGKEEILAQWKSLGTDLGPGTVHDVVREEPVRADIRPRDQVCSLCDGDIGPRGRILVKGASEARILCSPHCYFIYLSSLVGADPEAEAGKVRVTDSATGALIPAGSASYLYGMDAKGRATVHAYATPGAATAARAKESGVPVSWNVLMAKELATRCGFCDRAVYPEDACPVTVAGALRTQGCCTHCALGVAARLQKDIEVEARDGFSGETIRVRTLNGQIASIEPKSSIAWFGQARGADGRWASAGCFKQAFFVSQATLNSWLDARPAMTGRQITIAQALSDKMKLSPEQIAKACKLGECR